MILTVISLCICLLYIAVSLYLSLGLRNIDLRKSQDDNEKEYFPSVSVIAAARNEEHTLPKLLESLKNQTYPAEHFTVTVVNDRSSDRTAETAEEFKQQMDNLSLVTITEVPKGAAPKKFAVSQGIASSSGEIIIITDADCTVPPNWIKEVVYRFRNPRVGLVQGLTGYPGENRSLFHRFQRLDFFSHSVVAAAGIGAGIPINSNANNFSYRRVLFESLNGFAGCEHIVSGDDDLLLQKVWERGEWDISYLYTPDAAVTTAPAETFRQFIEQRKRWGSKTVYYKPLQTAVLSLIFLFYCITALQTILLASPFGSLPLTISLYGMKVIGELFFLIPGTAVFASKELRRDIWWASPLQLWLVLYSVASGVFGGFSWKGEKFRKSLRSN